MDKYYKNTRGEVFVYRSEKEMLTYGPADLTIMTEKEVHAHKNSNQNIYPDTVLQERVWRNRELVLADVEIYKLEDAGGDVTEWRKYRQELRDYPSTEGFPVTKHRPTAPNKGK